MATVKGKVKVIELLSQDLPQLIEDATIRAEICTVLDYFLDHYPADVPALYKHFAAFACRWDGRFHK